LQRAASLELDYALLGPVLPTPTHPESAGLGWAEFSRLIGGNTLPVLALGGMEMAMLAEAQDHGAHGIALMRGW
jgi:8-oxo-dGTP diphosphatase